MASKKVNALEEKKKHLNAQNSAFDERFNARCDRIMGMLQILLDRQTKAIPVSTMDDPKERGGSIEKKNVESVQIQETVPRAPTRGSLGFSVENTAKKEDLEGSAAALIDQNSGEMNVVPNLDISQDSILQNADDQTGQENLPREMKQNIQKQERILSKAISDADLPPFVPEKIQKMEETVAKANECIVECSIVERKQRQTLECMSLWAKRRGVYSKVAGCLGGINWALLTTRICQLYRNTLPGTVVSRFVKVYTRWRWPNPVMLCEIEEGTLGLSIWDPGGKREVLVEWKDLPERDATWEEREVMQAQFPDFNLEDKVDLLDGGIVTPVQTTPVQLGPVQSQPSGPGLVRVYSRRTTREASGADGAWSLGGGSGYGIWGGKHLWKVF